MNFRTSVKLAVLTSVLATTAVVAAPKKIVVYNKTSFNSTVRVTTGGMAGTCVGDKLWTKPGESKDIPWNSINMLCYGTFPCAAEVYVGNSHDCGAKTGSDDQLAGTVTLGSDGKVTVQSTQTNHDLVGGAAQLTLNK